MASYGIVVPDALPVAFDDTPYVAVLMHEDTAVDVQSLHGALPSSGWFGTLELLIEDSGGGAAVDEVRVFGTWDAAGLIPALPLVRLLSANNDWVAQQGAPSYGIMTSIKYDRPYKRPAGSTAGQIYLWFLTGGALQTANLRGAWLNWYLPSVRG